MKILVTGGAGYIGSHTIIDLLQKTENEVVSIDCFINSTSKTYDKIEEITGKSFKTYDLDLTNLEDLKMIFKTENFDGIIHFAALKSAPESVKEPISYFQNNLRSLLNVLECQKTFKVPYFIFSSSCSVYGNTEKLPVSELDELQIAESPYGSTKKMGEEILKDIFKNEKINSAISLRYFNPVGAHDSGLIGESQNHSPSNLFPLITQTAIGINKELSVFGADYNTPDGTCIRDYIHVSDIAAAHIAALNHLVSKKSQLNYDVFNLGSGKGYSVLEVIHSFEKVTGLKLNYRLDERREGDIVAVYADNTKAKKELGWEPSFGLTDMIKSAWNWQQNLAKKPN